jgi:hypothetical protein
MAYLRCRFSLRIAARGAACLTALLLAGSAMAEPQPAQVGGRIDVRRIDPTTLLFAVAEAVNFNVVSTVPQADVPASFATDYASIDDLLRKLANHVALRGVILGRRILVLSPCLAGEVENLTPGSGGRFSARLPDATVGEIVDAVASTEAGGGGEPEFVPRARRVVVRVLNVSGDDVLRAIAAAFGGTGAQSVGGAVAQGTCTALEDEAASAAKRRARALREATHGCAERQDSGPKSCQPLTTYELSQLTSRGYIEGYGRRFAFMQAPDGSVHVVRPGMTVGREGGQVLDVTRTEVTLSGPAAQALVRLQHWAVPSGLSAR